MADFIAQPSERHAKIPVITLQDLVFALQAYLPTIMDFSCRHIEFDSDREYLTTTLKFYQSDDGPTVVVDIEGRAATTSNSKLWNTSFPITIETDKRAPYNWFLVEPMPKRQIGFHRIARWEEGVPILASASE